MNKKAIAINTMILLVIGIVVLFVVLFIFRDQVGKALLGYTKVSSDAGDLVSGEKCQTMLGDRVCETGTRCEEGFRKVNLPAGKEKWKDCTTEQVCCEEVY